MNKKTIFILLSLSLLLSCHKPSGCTNAIVTLSAPSCHRIGVILNGVKYPTEDLPSQYAVDGMAICIQYSFWEDPAMCPCCGGRKVHIIAVQ